MCVSRNAIFSLINFESNSLPFVSGFINLKKQTIKENFNIGSLFCEFENPGTQKHKFYLISILKSPDEAF